MTLVLLGAFVVACGVGWLFSRARRALRDPAALRRAAETDIEMYRIRRALEVSEFKQRLQADHRRLRREVVRELTRLENWRGANEPTTRQTVTPWPDSDLERR